MTTVAQLIEHLQTLPQDASVMTLEEYSSGWDTCTRWSPIDIEKYSDNCNLYGDILYLGED